MRSLESASASWTELRSYGTLDDLKRAVRIEGHTSATSSAGLRSACWKIFLLFDSLDMSTWVRKLAASRSAYDSLRMHFLGRLENPDIFANDPLSDCGENSPWKTLQIDEELRAEIKQDVERCMPENHYFRQPDTQRLLLDILFVFCKLNPDVGYRQGMHEILAPVLWVVETDAIDLGISSKALGAEAIVTSIFDSEYVEHDSFALFSQIMQSAKNFYEQTTHSGGENPMIVRSKRIVDDMLPLVDPDLSRHLKNIEILPQVFLMRWIRLLFGREFPFDDVLSMWDLIFAEDPGLELVDHICLTLLLRIRWKLLEADYNTALSLLLKYNEQDGLITPQAYVEDAIYLRDHMNPEAGAFLVLRYSGRQMQPSKRPNTPPAIQRNITTFSGADTVGREYDSKSRMRPQRNLEVLLQSTARNIYARGGQAVRSAVDEVHKRALEIRETQTPRVPPRGYGPLYYRIKGLEKRNNQLAGLLDNAVVDLWDIQKRLMSNVENDNKSAATANIEELSVAVAKLQFIQAYISDPSMALPEKWLSQEKPSQTSLGERDGIPHSQQDAKLIPSLEACLNPSESKGAALKDPPVFDDVIARNQPTVTNRSKYANLELNLQVQNEDLHSTRDQQPSQKNDAQQSSQSENIMTSTTQRPSLSESSYSWMLDKADTRRPSSQEKRKSSGLFGHTRDMSKNPGPVYGQVSEQGTIPATKEDETFDLSSLKRGKLK